MLVALQALFGVEYMFFFFLQSSSYSLSISFITRPLTPLDNSGVSKTVLDTVLYNPKAKYSYQTLGLNFGLQ